MDRSIKLVQKSPSAQEPIQSMNIAGRSLRFVILQSPYDSMDECFTQDMFAKMVALKIKGYTSREYSYGVLPVDATDYVATHLLVCQEWSGQMVPLLGQRTISLKRCKTHHLPFPILNLTRSAHAPVHTDVVQKIIDRCDSKGIRLCYDSSITTHPDVKKDPELLAAIRDLMRVIHVAHHVTEGTQEILSMAVVKYKIDKGFDFLGYKMLQKGSETLPNLFLPAYANEEVKTLHLANGFTPQALELADRYKIFWENRIFVSGKLESEDKAILRAA